MIPPKPQDILQKHKPLLRLLVEALRKGTRHAQHYSDWQDEDLDRTLAPALVRKGAKRHLLAQGTSVADEEVEYEPEYLPNLGLAIAADGILIRILKSDDGMLPPPGPSKKRQSFYKQQLPLFPELDDNTTTSAPATVNLVLHWSPDEEYNLNRVYLACPEDGDTTKASVKAYWDEPIWRRTSVFTDSKTQQEEAEIQDLEIYLEADEKSGEGEG